MKNWLSPLLDLLFPPRCCACRNFCAQALCQNCLQSVTYLNLSQDLNGYPTYCITAYEGVIKKAIGALKFRKKRLLLPLLQSIVAENIPRRFRNADVLVPVPLSARRLKERGFNQAELLLQKFAQDLNKGLQTRLVVRNKNTKPLFSLTEIERQQEIANAFTLTQPQAISGKRVLLFDDILTTGTTVTEIGSLLTKSGAKAVYILGLAKTSKHWYSTLHV